MHSLIFDTVRDMVVEKFGEEAWKDLANKSSLPYTFETDAHFNDDLIYELLKHASEALKTTVDAILEQVGFWFIVFVKKSPEYANLLNMAGSSLVEIINNINSFHGHMKLSYFKNICPPTFRTTNVTSTSLRLHYIPGKANRKGLSSLVIGLVKGLAEVHLDLPANKLKIVLEKSAVKGADHDVFYISWRKLKEEKSVANKQQAICSIGLDGENLNIAFPFHFIVNKRLQIVQAGYALRKLIEIGAETLLTNKVEIISPKMETTFKSFQKNIGEPIILRILYDDTTNVDIHGEFLLIKDKTTPTNIFICFIGSPLFKSTQEVGSVGLCLSDFAVHDPAKDRLFAYDAESKSSARLKRIISDNYSNNSESDDSSISIDFTDIYNGSNGSNGMNVTFDKKYSAHMLQSTSSCPIKSVMPKGPSETNLKGLSHVSPVAPKVSSTPSSFITEKQSLIIDALLKDSWTKFELTKSLVEISIGDPDHKSFINTITDLFISLNRSNDLLIQSLRWELSTSNDANQMMRQDSVSSSILSAYSKRICSKVVKNLLQKLISDLHQLSKESLSEILNNQNYGAHLVEKIATKFLFDLCDSVSSWPSDFSKLLSTITQEASNAKGDEGLKFAHCTINSLLFLRLLSPAISFPDKFDIAPSAKLVEYQPILLLISKMINNLASGTQFDAGSPMSIYNSFISSENQLKIASFVNSLLDSHSKKSFSRYRPLSFALVDEFSTFLLMRIDRLFDLSFDRPLIKTFMKEIATAQLRNV